MKIALCDDDKVFLQILESEMKNLLARHNMRNCIIHKFDNPQRLINANSHEQYEAMFIDIEMPSRRGDDVARFLREHGNSKTIVFVSAHDQYVFETFDVSPVFFVRKHNLNIDLPKAIECVLKRYSESQETITLDSKTGVRIVNVNDISYISVLGHDVTLHLSGDSSVKEKYIELKTTLSKIEKELEAKGFIKCHKSFMVNYQYIYEIQRTEILLSDNYTKVPLSRNRIDFVKERFVMCRRFMQ